MPVSGDPSRRLDGPCLLQKTILMRQRVLRTALAPLLISIGAHLSIGSALAAQEEAYGPDESDFLLGMNAAYRYSKADAVNSSSDETELFQARFGVGYFSSRKHEFGLELVPDFVRTEAGGDTFSITLGPYYNYNHWTSPRTTLYAGPHAGLTYVDATGISGDSSLSYGVHGGLRYWTSPSVSINVEPRLTFADQEDDFGGDTTSLDLLLGVQFKL